MVNSGLSFIGVLIALLLINLKLGLTLLTIIPVLVAVTLLFRAKRRAPTARRGSGSAGSTPTCRRTWPGCAWRRRPA